MKRKPTRVLVHWSESRRFPKEGQGYDFAEFERIAGQVAHDNPPGSPYDKTKITVTFDDGETYQCRLDLKQGDERGFRDHVEQIIRWHEKRDHPSPFSGPSGPLCDFLQTIDFG